MADKEDKKDELPEVVAVDEHGKPLDPLPGVEVKEEPPKEEEPPKDDKAAKGRAEDEDDEDDEPEERVGHDDTGETQEQKLERRRQERAERKQKQREMIERDRRERQFLLARNQELEQVVGQLGRRVGVTERAAVQQRMAAIDQQLQLAEDVMAKAIEAGDGKTHAEALRIRDDLTQNRARLEEAAIRLEREQQAPPPSQGGQQPPQQAGGPDPEVVKRAKRFLSANPWYDPAGGDEDSAIAQVIDQRIRAEGLDPRTDRYWEELTSRLRKRLPDRFAQGKADGDAGDDDDDLEGEQPARRAAPSRKAAAEDKRRDAPSFPSSRPSRALKPGEVYVSPERKAAMIEHGVWDDPVLRARMLRRYQEWDQQNAKQ